VCTNNTDTGPFGVEVRLNTVFETPVPLIGCNTFTTDNRQSKRLKEVHEIWKLLEVLVNVHKHRRDLGIDVVERPGPGS
jgi:hypothetical protein